MKISRSSTDADGAPHQPAAESGLRDGGSRSQGETTVYRSAQQAAFNRSTRVAMQRRTLETLIGVTGSQQLVEPAGSVVGNSLSGAGGGAPVQRKIALADKKKSQPLLSAIGEIKETPTYAAVVQSPHVALVAEAASSSSAMPRFGTEPARFEEEVTKTHSTADGVDVYIPVAAADLTAGVKDPVHTIRADGQTEVRWPVTEDTGLLPIFDITGRYNTIKRETGEHVEPLEPPGISGATVVLHELGHALQYFSFLDDNKNHASSSGQILKVTLTTLKQIDSLEKDVKTHELATPRWTARVMELSALGEQLHRLHDLASDAKNDRLASEVDHLDELRLKALDIAKLWMEHDVMTRIEHPFANKRGEGIRLRHGEESDVTSKRFRGKAGRKEIEHHSPRNEMDRRGLNYGNAAENMKKQLQVDSAQLPTLVSHLLSGVKQLAMEEKVVEWLDD